MSWLAIIGALITLALEIIKIIRENKAESKEKAIELKKERTEILQSIVRGLADRDESRISSGFERLRLKR